MIEDPNLEKRIFAFYDSLNRGAFDEACALTDPEIPAKAPYKLYAQRMREFMKWCGSISIFRIDINLHINEKNTLYGDRDFAVGHIIWTDERGEEHEFRENWVKNNEQWHTRVMGFFPPRS